MGNPSRLVAERMAAYFDKDPPPEPTTEELAAAVGCSKATVPQVLMEMRKNGGPRIVSVRIWRVKR